MIRRVIANSRANPRAHIVLIAALTLLLFTPGCGNKGPLYLPSADNPPAQAPDTEKED